jgi:F0F1-type ATP synthase membrane subunit b/b'
LGELSEQKIKDQLKAEESQHKLLEMQCKSKEAHTQGIAKAKEEAKAKGEEILAKANVEVARLKAKAMNCQSEAELNFTV